MQQNSSWKADSFSILKNSFFFKGPENPYPFLLELAMTIHIKCIIPNCNEILWASYIKD
jgi:hypothetical protein